MKSWFAKLCRNVHSFTFMVPKYIWAVSAGPFWTKMSIPLPIPLKKNSVFYSLVAIFKCNESLFTDLILQCWFLKAQCCFGCSHTLVGVFSGNRFPLSPWAHCFCMTHVIVPYTLRAWKTDDPCIQWFEFGSAWIIKDDMGKTDEAMKE